MLIFGIVSVLLSHNILSFYFIHSKRNFIFNSKIRFSKLSKLLFSKNYFKVIDLKLQNLGNPYGLNVIRYCMFKYLFSSFIFLVILFKNKNALLALIFFVIFFFLPNFLVYLYKKSEGIKIINEISNIVQNLILSLSANLSLYESIKMSKNVIIQKRFKAEYEKFIEDYAIYNFNILKATHEFKQKFNSYEFTMFISILIQGEKEGNLLKNLEIFNESLDIIYFKFLKYNAAQRVVLISFATVISLFNSFLVVMYPIMTEVSNNLVEIFK